MLDVNDNAPRFDQDLYSGEVDEDSPADLSIVTVSAKDADQGANGTVRYSLEKDAFSDLFNIDDTSGKISTKAKLSIKDSPDFNLTVIASDLGVPVMSSEVTLMIKVNGENEPPVFTKGDYSFSISEDALIGTTVGTLVAIDNDPGDDGVVMYTFVREIIGNKILSIETVNNTGVLKVSDTLDRESREEYRFVFSVADAGKPSLKDEIEVNITVLDVNDNVPIFTELTENVTIAENTAVGTTIMNVVATDMDTAENGSILYSIEPTNEYFTVDSKVGNITLSKSITPNKISKISFTIVASDEGIEPKMVKSGITILVSDINESPYFINATFLFSIVENAERGTTIGRIIAKDDDPSPNSALTYSIVNTTKGSDIVVINSTTGSLTFLSSPDRETDSEIILRCRVNDSGSPSLTDEVDVTIIINDENDNAPIFSEKEYNDELQENARAGLTLTTVHATDKDFGNNGSVVYSIEPRNEYFVVNRTTGEITLSKSIIPNTVSEINFTVVSSDEGPVPKVTKAVVTVTVIDINEVPYFTNETFAFSINENVNPGTVIGTIIANDDDLQQNSQLTYSIGNATKGSDIVVINTTTGTLSFSSSPDRETNSEILLRCRVSDSGSPSLTDEVDVTIIINDENDNAPVFTENAYKEEIQENAKAGLTLTTVHATDKDFGDNGSVIYFIEPANEFFVVNRTTGEITLSKSLIPNTASEITLSVVSRDQGPVPKVAKALVNVTVIDINESPYFINKTFLFSINENAKSGTVLGTITAKDDDLQQNSKLTYNILSSTKGSNIVVINSTTGSLSFSSSPDRETDSEIILRCRVNDSGSPSLTDEVDVTIIINDENDNAAVFTENEYKEELQENAKAGLTLTTVHATDKDFGDNGSVIYSIEPRNEYFVVNRTTGEITLSKSIIPNTVSEINFTVVSSDEGPVPKVTNAVVTVIVIDINEAPYFTNETFAFSINENVNPGTVIGTIIANDDDLQQNSQLTYSIGNTTKGSDIVVINTTTGTLSFSSSPDRETNSEILLRCRVSDSGSPSLTDEVDVTIIINDENDNAPVFIENAYKEEIQENAKAGLTLITVHATDKDFGDNGSVIYSIEPANEFFVVNRTTGEIALSKSLIPNTVSEINFTVVSSDEGPVPKVTNAVVTVTIIDINEAPYFINETFSFNIIENAKPGTVLGTLIAKDDDLEKNSVLSYSIVNVQKGSNICIVSSTTGAVFLSSSPDREVDNEIMIRCRVRDSGTPSLQAEVNVTITISDENDNAPIFSKQEYIEEIQEIAKAGLNITTVYATDKDFGNNGNVIYSIEPDDMYLGVNNETGEITLLKSITPNTIYNITSTLTASDQGAEPKITKAKVTVIVHDINEPPFFVNETYSFNIIENTEKGVLVGKIYAKDNDLPGNSKLTYALVSVIEGGVDMFEIDDQTGALHVLTPPDREQYSIVVLKCDVHDNGDHSLSDEVNVTIKITDDNDNAPVFSDTYRTEMMENATVGSSVITVNATDADEGVNGQVVFSIDPPNEYFTMSSDTGDITLSKRLPQNTLSVMTLTVVCVDKGSNPQMNETSVTVKIVDINDPPYFINETYSFSIAENVAKGTIVGKLQARDEDLGENSKLNYHILETIPKTSMFMINAATGAITISNPPDREVYSHVLLKCKVEDSGDPILSDEATVKIQITDMNDNAPVFNQTSYIVDVMSNATTSSSILTVRADDIDKGKNGDVVYRIKTSTTDSASVIKLFAIDSATGMIVTIGRLDQDINMRDVQFDVVATDLGDEPRSATANVKINIIPVYQTVKTTASTTSISTRLSFTEDSTKHTVVPGNGSASEHEAALLTTSGISALSTGLIALVMPIAALLWYLLRRLKKKQW